MAFKLSVISTDPSGAVCVAGYGEATATDFPTQQHMHFDMLLGANWASRRVALDLDAVPYLDSSAIGWFIQAQKQFRLGGGYLVLYSVQPHVKNILHLLKIERVVPIGSDLASALKLLQEQPQVEAVA